MKKLLLLTTLWCIGIAYTFADETFRYKDPQNVVWICSPTNDADETAVGSCVEITGVKGCGTEVEVPGTVYDSKGTAYTVVKLPGAFADNTELQKVTLPTSVTILDGTFNGCTALTTVENTSQISKIGEKTFYGTHIKSINLSSCTSVGEVAFSRCSYLTSIDLPACTYVGELTFYFCTSLTSIDLPACTTVERCAFYFCTSLTSIDLPACTTVEEATFRYCTGITSIDLPACTTVGDLAFLDFTGLTSVNLPVCTTVGERAFHNCTSLTSIDLPACTTVGDCAFKNCTVLASLDLSSIEALSSNAFEGYTSLTSIKLSSCKSVGVEAFSGCTGLKSVILPACTHVGASAFYRCTSLTSINLSKCTYVGASAFSGLTGLKSVRLPACTEVGWYAFYGCTGLTSIDLPSSVTYIDSFAFGDCSELTQIYVSWDTPLSIWANTFDGVDKQKCTLYVPEGTLDKYKSAYGWNKFENIVEYDVTGIDNPSTGNGAVETARYSANGQRVTAPVKGLNIVKYSDGSTKKVVVK